MENDGSDTAVDTCRHILADMWVIGNLQCTKFRPGLAANAVCDAWPML
jgi:hypothetical protein